MQINYAVVAVIVAVAVLFILLLVRKNIKDEKQFEHNVNKQGIPPEKHDRDESPT